MKIIIILFSIFYFLYTLRFAILFNKTDVFFSGGIKFLHNIAIWFIPFLWIVILKQLSRHTQGSHNRKKTFEGDDYSLQGGSDGD